MFGKYFTYDDKSSEDFTLMIGSFDIDIEIPMGLSRDILKGEMNRFRSIPNHMGTSYNDVLSFQITLLKDKCKITDINELYFTEDEIDDINTWLTSSDYPILFHMYSYDDDTDKKYDYFGIFTEVDTNVIGGKVIGLTYTFTTNAPYAFTELVSKEFSCSGTTELSIEVNTSERKHEIYPVIKLTPSGSETGRVEITITNETDGNREMQLSVLKEPITIDCGKCKISDEVGLISFEDLGISDVDYVYWLRLYHGTNKLIVKGDTKITFEYREPRKVGAY